RYQLVGVGLVAHVPDQLVSRCIENGVQSQGELNYTEIGTQMPAGHRDGLYDARSDLLGQSLKLRSGQPLEVARRVDSIQKSRHQVSSLSSSSLQRESLFPGFP